MFSPPQITVEKVVEELINHLNPKKSVRYLNALKSITVKTLLIKEETKYINRIKKTSHEIFRIRKLKNVGGILSKNDMSDLYSKLSNSIYHTIIKSNGDICPYCNERPISHLDHFLPKAVYPQFAITPVNLIPSCSDCNSEGKNQHVPKTISEQFIHPYYEEINNESWLLINYKFNPAFPLNSFKFEVRKPDSWDNILFERVKFQFEKLKLNILYSIKTTQFFHNNKSLLFDYVDNGGINILKSEINKKCSKKRNDNLNHWETALYICLDNLSEIDLGELIKAIKKFFQPTSS